MGANVLPMARQVLERIKSDSEEATYSGYETSLEDDLIGVQRTGSADALVTDSAASASAVSTGSKTNNGYVSVDTEGKALGSILEAAKQAGYLTGVITTSYIYDASPSAFTAHSVDRDDFWFIANQQIGWTHPLGRVADVLLGGGRCAFIPQGDKDSCRYDDYNLIKLGQEKYGWNYVDNTDSLKSASQLPLLGLFAPENMAAQLDRPSNQPKLQDMVDKALELLSAKVESDPKTKGFFLFYESEVTDSAQHSNDAIGTFSAAVEISDTAILVKDWYKKLKQKGDDTLFFSTSDHETGGFAIGADVEDPVTEAPLGWEPLVLANASHSATYTADLIAEAAGTGNAPLEVVRQIVSTNLRIQNYTQAEAELVAQAGNSTDDILPLLTSSVDSRARVGWTTEGHTAADVNIYCYENPYCLKFRGSHDNTDLTRLMAEFLGDVDIKTVTSELNGFNATAPTLAGEPVGE